jgi:hypothetical protein
MATKITNESSTSLTLPAPYGLVIPPGAAVIVDRTEAQVLADLGGAVNFADIRLDAASDSDADLKNIVVPLPPLTFNAQPVNEVFFQDNVAASQTDVALGARTRVSFADVVMPRAGSIVGLVTRFNDDVTAGTATIVVAVNGTPGTLSVVSTAGANPGGGEAIQAAGVDTFAAGDALSLEITTDGSFAPITTDMEAWIEVSNAVA